MAAPTTPEPGSVRTVPFDIWETGGITEHMGGLRATQHLIELCHVAPGRSVLVLGCGTGHTACFLAQQYQARVVALDLSARSVAEATRRVAREALGHQVAVVLADAHLIPFLDCTFDVILSESVLVFCRAERVVAEAYRVLKPRGTLGANELTLLAPPPPSLDELLQDRLGIHSFQEEGWRSMLVGAGFAEVESTVRPVSLREQMASHLQVDGLRRYLSSLVRGIADRGIRRAFFNREMLGAARQFLPYVGYGLYVGRKG